VTDHVPGSSVLIADDNPESLRVLSAAGEPLLPIVHSPSHARHTVLVVDDDIQVLRTFTEILARDGFDVLTAEDAAPALAALRESLPCMILLDVELPGMNGFELCRHLRRDPRTAHIPVALVTARISEDDVKEGISAGAVDYIKKPFDMDEVRMRVRTQIRLHETMVEQERMHEELCSSERRFEATFEQAAVGMAMVEPEGKFFRVNRRLCDILGYTANELTGLRFQDITHPDDLAPDLDARRALRSGELSVYSREKRYLRKDGKVIWIKLVVAQVRSESGQLDYFVTVFEDITNQKQIEIELEQARKLEAVGQLASGIAHEINTPAQYVGDGVHFLKEAFAGYQRLVGQYRLAVETLEKAGGHETLIGQIREIENDIDLPYLDANAPASFDSCLDGVSRISTIVRAMKEFAHPDQKEKVSADLNRALQTTLNIARNEYKYVADVATEFGDLPPVFCHVGDLNQVFLNLIVNAAHAIGDVVRQSGRKGTIRIRTSQEGGLARIDIADTGAGIPEAIRQRVFEPFFTTKEVGKGTGQGLAIARSIVVSKHGGTLMFESEVGKGTTFTIRLPIGDSDASKGGV
jgi:PAS domain S-box-containing protein